MIMLGLSTKFWWLVTSIPIATLFALGVVWALPVILGSTAWTIADRKCGCPWWLCLANHLSHRGWQHHER